MYQSTLMINIGDNPDRPRPGRLWLRNIYHVHQRLWMAFPTSQQRADDPFTQSVNNGIYSIGFSPDRSILATGDLFGIKLWGVATGQLIRRLNAPYRAGRSAVLFSPDGTRVAQADANDTILVWDAWSGARLFEIQTGSNCAVFSRDGRRLAVGFSDREEALKVFDLEAE